MQGFPRAIRRLRVHADVMNMRQAASLAARLKYPEPRRMTDNRRNQIRLRTEYLISRYAHYFQGKRNKKSLRQESRATI